MGAFDFVFSLIGLLLGLSLVEVLGGLMRTLKARSMVRIGLLTPLLGIWVIADVTSFWGMAWQMRPGIERLPSIWPVLGLGVLVTSAYYAAASLVFPDRPEDVADLDDFYWKHKRTVILLVTACELAAMAANLGLGRIWSPASAVLNVGYIAACIATAFVSGRSANVLGLSALLAIAVWMFFPYSG